MKKLFLVLFLMIFLMSCNGRNEYVVPIFQEDIETCGDSCLTSLHDFVRLESVYENRVNALVEEISNGKVDTSYYFMMNTDQLYSRDDLPRDDFYTLNQDISIITPYQQVKKIISTLDELVNGCTIEGVCTDFSNFNYPNASDVSYGFDNNSGFYSFTCNKGTDDESVYAGKFLFGDHDVSYYIYGNRVNADSIDFLYIFKDGIFSKYQYRSDDSFLFMYIDVNLRKYLCYDISDISINEFAYYDAEKEISYRKTYADEYIVSKLDNMEFVASLSLNAENQYISEFSFHAVEGWDSLYFQHRISTNETQNQLYNHGSRVFDDYDIHAGGLLFIRYVNVNGWAALDEDSLNDYVYPESFTGGITLLDLKAELDQWLSKRDILDIANVKESQLLDCYNDQLDAIKNLLEE